MNDLFLEGLSDRFSGVVEGVVEPVTIEEVQRRATLGQVHRVSAGAERPGVRRRAVAALVVAFSLCVVGAGLAGLLAQRGAVAPSALVGGNSGPCAGQPPGWGSPESSAAALATGRWSSFPRGPLSPRTDEVEVWTGRELLIWGGASANSNQSSIVLGDGAAYDPDNEQWRPIAAGPLSPRQGAAAVWTGSEMIVVGGQGNGTQVFDDAAAYDPATNSWRSIASFPLEARTGATAIWTGKQLVVIGGYAPTTDSATSFEDGAAYTPSTGKWAALPPLPATPGKLAGVDAAWTGNELIVWLTSVVTTTSDSPNVTLAGGASACPCKYTSTGQAGFGLAAGSSTWAALPKPPVQTEGAGTAWTGSVVLVIGGNFCPAFSCGIQFGSAASYDPTTRTWAKVPYPTLGNGSWPSVWTGGAFVGPSPAGQGNPEVGAYSPTSGSWTVIAQPPDDLINTLVPGIWTGRQLLLWGVPSMVPAGPRISVGEQLTVGGE
jgi:hypothetical protein